MRDSVSDKEWSECEVFAPVVRVEGNDIGFKALFNQTFESDKGFFNLGFLFEGIEPSISGIVVDKDDIIFVVIG